MRARDIMTTELVTVPPDMPTDALATLMADRHVSGAPVVDADGRLVGLVTDGDLMRRLSAREDKPASFLAALLGANAAQATSYARAHGRRVRDLMSTDLATVTEEATVEEVAHILETRRIRRVPVVRDGVLVGVVSRADLLRAVMAPVGCGAEAEASDPRIRRAIYAAMAEQPWISTRFVFPMVQDGVVSFHGFLGSQEALRALRVLAEGVVGVREVRFETTPPPRMMLGVP
ncbi:CBS domain-containing protein [Roseomonas sp. CECT 9278]|uniref:CBS domain-containing protein n=1 Tax=Roseomonas sp. CECT 9278 TaxID=2845823 RepID=UPI001E369B86|nr:CBS domain-containing protein [Roseomonas sp. CECT 9278]CAH0305326.1 Inosine-5'-monophosphate dehydrogenase [Roseomonas sp. CECT 9278]